MFNSGLQHFLIELFEVKDSPEATCLFLYKEDLGRRLLIFDLNTKVGYFTFDEKKKHKIANQIC